MSDINKKIKHLSYLHQTGNYDALKTAAIEVLDQIPDHIDALNALAISYKWLGNTEKAKEIFIKLVNSGLKSDYVYSNAGNFFYDIGNINNALECHQQAIKLNPKNVNSLNQLGLISTNMGKDKDAISYYKKVLEIQPNEEIVHHNIGNAYRNLEQYQYASDHYELSDKPLSKCQQLECLYKLNDEKGFFEKLDIFSKTKGPHPLAAALSAHASVRYDKKDNYDFCEDPFQFIHKKNLFDRDDFNDNLIKNFFNLFNEAGINKKQQALLKNGYQSSGNLFRLRNDATNEIEKIIMEEIKSYKNKYSNTNASMINKWPDNANLYGWLIVMNKGGSLSGHMHKEGWLSGSLYLERPKKQKKVDGDIIFSLHGSNLPTDGKAFKTETVNIEKGDIVMFPSSLFHATHPFESDDKRITLAFDIIPDS